MKNLQILFATLLVLFLFQSAKAAIYISGHADIGAGFEDGNLHLHLHADTELQLFGGGTIAAGSELEAGALSIGVPDPSTARPDGDVWNFLATNAGDPVWFLPATSDPDKPYLGIGTEELNPADGWATPLNWSFNSITTISGEDSEFAIWQVDGFGGLDEVFASSLVPTASGNTWTQDAGSHEHYLFGFTGQGVYEVNFTIDGMNDGSGMIAAGSYSDTASYRFATGSAVPEPSSLLLLGCLSAGAIFRRRKSCRPTFA